jgi:hypothetical protein
MVLTLLTNEDGTLVALTEISALASLYESEDGRGEQSHEIRPKKRRKRFTLISLERVFLQSL